jgi:hypothetical protein
MAMHTCNPALGRLRQDHSYFEANLGNTVRTYLKKKKKKANENLF